MNTIKLQTGEQFEAAICPRCAGGARVFPASALAAHIERHDSMFSVPGKYHGGGRKKGAEIRKRMCASGMEFRESIKSGWGARMTK